MRYVPLNGNAVLKRLPEQSDTSKVSEFSFNKSLLEVLKENCGFGIEKQKVQKKRD